MGSEKEGNLSPGVTERGLNTAILDNQPRQETLPQGGNLRDGWLGTLPSPCHPAAILFSPGVGRSRGQAICLTFNPTKKQAEQIHEREDCSRLKGARQGLGLNPYSHTPTIKVI